MRSFTPRPVAAWKKRPASCRHGMLRAPMRLPASRAALSVLVMLAACDGCRGGRTGSTAPPEARHTARAPVTVTMAYGSEKKTWLDEQLKRFAATSPRTAAGSPIQVDARAMGSGEAQQAVLSGSFRPVVFSPASGVYVSLLNEAWLHEPGRIKPISPQGEPLVLSPIVIAIWRPMAEALGWPNKVLGWSDVLKVSPSPGGWGGLRTSGVGALQARPHPPGVLDLRGCSRSWPRPTPARRRRAASTGPTSPRPG